MTAAQAVELRRALAPPPPSPVDFGVRRRWWVAAEGWAETCGAVRPHFADQLSAQEPASSRQRVRVGSRSRLL
ncbi:hypothetical protein [Streptomyces sp. NPDC017435]|uniref:hypothetical protein n=1 Tax=Streptomyces sp. NPDC017435 TaxID=3364995 RepID=UPI00379F02D0